MAGAAAGSGIAMCVGAVDDKLVRFGVWFSSGAHRARRFQVAGAAADSKRIYQLGHHARRGGLSCGWSGMAMCVGAFNDKLVRFTPGSTSQANAGAT